MKIAMYSCTSSLVSQLLHIESNEIQVNPDKAMMHPNTLAAHEALIQPDSIESKFVLADHTVNFGIVEIAAIFAIILVIAATLRIASPQSHRMSRSLGLLRTLLSVFCLISCLTIVNGVDIELANLLDNEPYP